MTLLLKARIQSHRSRQNLYYRMIVKVKVQGATITISCGNGRQTFRWLGSVVQARIKQYGVLKNRYEEDNYIVTEIRNGDDQLINPADLLLEHAGSGTLEVTAIVTSHFPVDEWEIPEMGDWLKGAHVKSKIGSQWMNEIEAWRGSLQNMKDATNRGEGQESNVLLHRAQPQTSNLIQIGFDFTESDINSAFDLDWSVMKWDWLQPTELLKNQLGDVLKRNYASVCNLFAHYCGVGQVGQRYGLTMQEFGHLLHYLKVCNFKSGEDLIEDIYFKTGNVGGGGAVAGSSSSKFSTAGKWPLMTRAHLAQAVICTALLEKDEDCGDAEALRKFFDSRMSSLWENLTAEYLFYASEDPVVKKSVFEYYPLLKQVFLSRAATDSKYGPRLALSAFIRLLEEVSLVEPEQESLVVGAFLEAQLGPSPAWELEHLVFTEFMEALSRVAVKAIEQYKESNFTDGKRIRMAYNFVSELNEESGNNRSHK